MRSQKKRGNSSTMCWSKSRYNRKHKQSERNQTKGVDLLRSFIPAFPAGQAKPRESWLVTTYEHTDMCGRALYVTVPLSLQATDKSSFSHHFGLYNNSINSWLDV